LCFGVPGPFTMSIVLSSVPGQRWGTTFASSPAVVMPQPQVIARPQPQIISMPGAQVISMPQSTRPLGKPGGIGADELKKFKKLFAKADKDGNNTLDSSELTTIMGQMGMPTTPQALQQFMTKYDSDRDGKISFQEFMAAFHTAPAALPPRPQLNTVGNDGKFVDQTFPPNNDSVFRTPNPAADHAQDVMKATQGGKIQWKRASEICKGGKLFDNVHPNDIAQGVLGDCWLLAGLAALAEFEGAVFHHV